jgi:FKBP-type peptidyl-prolyl cis-trans isomerase FklB
MTFFKVLFAGAASAVLLSGTAQAQTKKPTPKPAATSKPTSRPAAPATGVSLRTNNDSLSYSIGLNIAQNMKQQGLTDINSAILAKGINDALKGDKTAMTPEQANVVLGAFMQQQMAVRQAETAKVSEGNKKVGNAFLAENKTKPGVVTTPSGLQYKIVKEGTGAKPTSSDRVKVNYTGRLIDGKVFDSSEQRGPAEFGVTEVIKGWTEVLQLMPVGSRWTVYIPSDLAYGDRGAGGGEIGPGATLIFDVELLDIVKTNE